MIDNKTKAVKTMKGSMIQSLAVSILIAFTMASALMLAGTFITEYNEMIKSTVDRTRLITMKDVYLAELKDYLEMCYATKRLSFAGEVSSSGEIVVERTQEEILAEYQGCLTQIADGIADSSSTSNGTATLAEFPLGYLKSGSAGNVTELGQLEVEFREEWLASKSTLKTECTDLLLIENTADVFVYTNQDVLRVKPIHFRVKLRSGRFRGTVEFDLTGIKVSPDFLDNTMTLRLNLSSTLIDNYRFEVK